MSRINTNVSSLLAQRILGQQNKSLTTSLQRLSTGLAINRGADDPAGLIASEKLRSEEASISAAIGNAERADQVINIAEGGLQEVSSLLIELQGLVTETANDAGLSREEKEANQLQIDSILQTIDRIAATTSFGGVKLLNGTYDFTVSGVNAEVDSFQVHAAKLSHNEQRDVKVTVTDSAQHGSLFLSAGGNTALDLTDGTESFVFELAGAKGSREFSFASGTTLADMASTINTFKEVTGVSAINSGAYVKFRSTELGSENFVSFKVVNLHGLSGNIVGADADDEDVRDTAAASATALSTIAASKEVIRDNGEDVEAVINGIVATARGENVSINTDFLTVDLTLTAAGAQTKTQRTAFTITGGGAQFNLGPDVDIINQVSVGIKNVAARNLGSTAVGGFLDDLQAGKSANVVSGNLETAQKIVNKAIDTVSSLRGRMGAFQKNVIGASIRSLGVALENTSAAESSIRDTDFAAETAELTRSQILVQAATNVLGIANQQPQAVLSLLG